MHFIGIYFFIHHILRIFLDVALTDKASEAASITSLTEIVKALEVDSGFLELVCKQHEENTEETEILTAISENLEKLRHLVMNSPRASPRASPKTSPKGDMIA